MSAQAPEPLVFLLDVDNTLLDNDRLVDHLMEHIEREYGAASRERYGEILEQVRSELGYVDYLGALQQYRIEHLDEPGLLNMSSFLVDYPFAQRLFPRALEVLEHLGRFGTPVILSDGDVVFQPRKVKRSGLWDAVDGRVLIYIHKEEMLDAVARRHPASHYVIVDDKMRILDAVKTAWGARVTTVFVRQGHYAHDTQLVRSFPPADVTIERVGDLLHHSFAPQAS
ncbi:MAG TPA: HAD family hydrolase [Steroidobacteraceae bacterium]|nr:HAD family hydrolase [Steroidobacteraceae bacterium]